ncbi:hypothetical protein HYH03_014575 [Edaphochlamys debaryana]|uniref:Uncharacterized protein n=1 Tax=Edaphochlamys debaryana TaxID=47281 RepID=A0A836BRU0_9CHLO|nr:hypothetical protein HYH03_014575 [Edaphochlamys debaryana]|eukprot:KAG2486776.1 hypothetical protein HYH03_014575 [Edaphochlamys debaryana]
MGAMYDRWVGPASLGNAAQRLEAYDRGLLPSGTPDGSSRGAALDSGDRGPAKPSPAMAVALAAANSAIRGPLLDELHAQRAAGVTMKYVAPHIAKKYGVQQSIRPASERAAAAAAAGPSSMSSAPSAAATGAGQIIMASDKTPNFASSAAAASRPPRPASATFLGVSREHAQKTGSRFLYGGKQDVPSVGKYTPKYGALDKATQLVRDWSKQPDPNANRDASSSGLRRPGSAPAGSRRAGVSLEPSRVSVAPSIAADGERRGTASGEAGGGPKRSLSMTSVAGPAQPAPQMDARTQAQVRHEELFAGAHRVHEPKPPLPPGTPCFKAPGRKPPDNSTTAGHLFGAYYQQGYDSLTKRSSRPSSAFHVQVPRPPPTKLAAQGDTSPALGPGTYNVGRPLPASNTGKHVNAGHSYLAQTVDFTRRGPRPVSAPNARGPPQGAMHHGYWGPNGPVTSLFPDEPEFDGLVGIRHLQERVQAQEDKLRPRLAAQRQAAEAAAGGGGGEVPPPPGLAFAAPGDDRPLTYVGPERMGDFGSAGFARRVPGGTFSATTRAGTAQGMRVMADGKVIPPAAVSIKKGLDLEYDFDPAVVKPRHPSWQLPPNRQALSQRWITTAATAYLD